MDDIKLVQFSNSGLYGGRSVPSAPRPQLPQKSRFAQAKLKLSNYKQLRDCLLFLNCLTLTLSLLNYQLQAPPTAKPPLNACLLAGIAVHALTFAAYTAAVSSYGAALALLGVSKASDLKWYVARRALTVGLALLVFPLPFGAAVAEGLREKYFEGETAAAIGTNRNVPLSFIEVTAAFASLAYFLVESFDSLTVRAVRVRSSLGRPPDLLQTFKRTASTRLLFALLGVCGAVTVYLGIVVQRTESAAADSVARTSDYGIAFLAADSSVNRLGSLELFANSLWTTATAVQGVMTSELTFRANLTKIVVVCWAVLGCIVAKGAAALAVGGLFWAERPAASQTLLREKVRDAASDLIKVFFFRFLVYKSTKAADALLEVDNKLKVASLRFRRVRQRAAGQSSGEQGLQLLSDGLRLKDNTFLLDRLLTLTKRG